MFVRFLGFVKRMSVQRQAIYFRSGEQQIFGWYHYDVAVNHRDCVAVVCPPFGYEYTHAHRSLRHLCDQLALSGINALRFDYHGTGDSASDDLASGRLSQWQNDVASAVEYARKLSGRRKCAVVGVRFGAMLAVLASAQVSIDYLVLWNSVVKGRSYVRELKLLAGATQENVQIDDANLLESGGYTLLPETQDDISAVDLKEHPVKVSRMLVLHSGDLPQSFDRRDWRGLKDVPLDFVVVPGKEQLFDLMAAQPAEPVQPAILEIAAWLLRNIPLNVDASRLGLGFDDYSTVQLEWAGSMIFEHVCKFGDGKQLFGILTTSEHIVSNKPTVLLLNSGSVHHVGPGRLYVNLARELAQKGFHCFRFDIEGIGDSVFAETGWENHPYSSHAVDDVAMALFFLQSRFGLDCFALGGLCSGAYAAFMSGVNLPEACAVRHVFLINPLTFDWVEGQSLEVAQKVSYERWELNHYKSSVYDWERWVKFFLGRVDYASILLVLGRQIMKSGRSLFNSFFELMLRRPLTPLDLKIALLEKSRRSISIFVASSDAGYDLLMRDGGAYTRRQVRNGKISINFIENADHTFTRLASRRALFDLLVADLVNMSNRSKLS